MSIGRTATIRRPAIRLFARPLGSEGWYHCDRALMPKIGTVVEAQDGTRVFWGGVNWWRADEWKTHMVKKYRYLPNAQS